MQPPTREILASNAYRTLGLSASASQEAIEAAARRMRIWPDPQHIPPTPFDLPWLGAIPRTRNDIEQALSRLTHPASRVEERIFWYHGQQPPESLNRAGELHERGKVGAGPEWQQHDAALAMLQAASIADPQVADTSLWQSAIDSLRELSNSAAYLDWLVQIERDGDFEKRATTEEVAVALNELPAALAAMLFASALAALDRGDINACSRIGMLLRPLFGGDGGASGVVRLIERMEDTLTVHCDEMARALRNALSMDHANPRPSYARNKEPTRVAAALYNDRIHPILAELQILVDDGEETWLRARMRCAKELKLLALGWDWSGEFILAEQTLLQALDLAIGTSMEAEIIRELADSRPKADWQRSRTPATPQATPAPPRIPIAGRKQYRWLSAIQSAIETTRARRVAALLVVIMAIKTLSSYSGCRNTDSLPSNLPAPTAAHGPDWDRLVRPNLPKAGSTTRGTDATGETSRED